MGTPNKKRGELYSHSRLSSFEDCPKKFYYRYVLRLPSDTESIEGFLGKRVHEVLERLYEFAVRGLVPSLEKVLYRFHALWDQHYDPARIRIVRDQPASHYRSRGEHCLTGYYRSHYPFDRDETVGLEQHVTFSLDESGSYRIRGIVDRIARARDGAIEIIDYKTSQRVPSQNRLDRDRQLALYQMALAERFGEDTPIRLVWHYVQTGVERRSERTPQQLEDLRLQTISLIDRIRLEAEYAPKTGPLCDWCEFNDRCEAYPRRSGPRAIPTRPLPPEPPAPAGQQRLL